MVNRAQRLTLLIVLAFDVLLILWPPCQIPTRFGHFDIGHHWLPYIFGARDALALWDPLGARNLPGAMVSINFGTLAGEIAIVSMIGLTVFVLAREIPDGRTRSALRRISVVALAAVGFVRSIAGIPRTCLRSLDAMPEGLTVLAIMLGLMLGFLIFLLMLGFLG